TEGTPRPLIRRAAGSPPMKLSPHPGRVPAPARLLVGLALVMAPVWVLPAVAQDADAAAPVQGDSSARAEEGPSTAGDVSPEERRQREKEARIEEYLRKK